MSRLPLPPVEELSAEQKRLHEEFMRARGRVAGPYSVWLRTPEIAESANQLSSAMRNTMRTFGDKIDNRLFELMILIVTSRYGAQFPWAVHRGPALEYGIAPEVVEALEARRAPKFSKADEQLLYDVVTELNEAKGLSKASYDRAIAALGAETLIALVTAVGWFNALSMLVNTFDVDTPAGAKRLP